MLFSPVPGPWSDRRWLAASGVGLLGFLTVAGLMLATRGVDGLDVAVGRESVSLRSSSLTDAARAATFLGSTHAVVAAAVVAGALLWWRTGDPTVPLVLLSAVAVTLPLVRLLKTGFDRARPPLDALLGPPALDHSFPSGHTADGGVVYALAAVLLALTFGRVLLRRLVVAVGVVVVVAIGLSRVYLGYHWATDVVAGWLLAGAIVAAAVYLAGVLAGPRVATGGVEAPGGPAEAAVPVPEPEPERSRAGA